MHLAALTGRGAPDTLGRPRKRAAGVDQDHPASRPRTTTPGPSVNSGHTGRCNYIHHARHRLFPSEFTAGSGVDRSSEVSSTRTNPRPGERPATPHRGYTCDRALLAALRTLVEQIDALTNEITEQPHSHATRTCSPACRARAPFERPPGESSRFVRPAWDFGSCPGCVMAPLG